MNTLKRFVTAFKAAGSIAFPRATSYFFGWGELGASDVARRVGDGLDHNVLVSPLLWIARAFPEAPLSVRSEDEKGKRTVMPRHPMVKLFARPNAHYSGESLWFGILISFLTDGNGYIAKVRGARGQVAELWYLPHWMVEPKGDEREFITHFEYRPGHTVKKFAPSDIIHFRMGVDPRNTRKGFSPLRALMTVIFTDSEAANLTASLLKNRGIPGLVISPDKDVVLQGEDENALKQAVIEKTTGNQRGTALVVSAAVKVQTFGFSPSEMDLSATHNTSEERVCAALGLPAGVAGFGSGNETTKVGATLRELVKLAWTGCILPLQRTFASEITRSLLPDFDKSENVSAFFDTGEVEALQPNRLEIAQACREEYEGGMATRGEVRAKLNYDVTEADNVFAVLFSVTLTPRTEGATPPEPAREPATPGAPAGGAKSAKHLTRLQARILRAKDLAYKRFEPRLRKSVKGLLERMGHDAEQGYLRANRKGIDDELEINEIFSNIDTPKYTSELRKIFATHYVSVHNDNVGTLADLGLSMDLPDSVQIEVLSRGGSRAGLVDLTKAARARALSVIQDSREAGLSTEETARRLRDAVPGGPFSNPETRAEIIARTETRYAQTTSSLMTYRTLDGVDEVMMIDGRLGPTDEDCESLNETRVTFAEAQRLLDQEHPNGTRDLVPVFSQESQ